MATTVADVLSRRIPARFLDAEGAAGAARQTADMLAGELGLTAEAAQRQIDDFTADVRAEQDSLAAAPAAAAH